MRNYEVQSIIQPSIKDAFVTRSRQQALDIFKSKLLKYAIYAFTIELVMWRVFGVLLLPTIEFVAIAIALYDYARALCQFTVEDRDYLFGQQSIVEVESKNALTIEEKPARGDTLIPQDRGSGVYFLTIPLSESQKKAIANTMLNTETLTVNYLESIGLSRQNAEGLRAELAGLDILEFDNKGRVSLTDKGEKICKRIIKD